MRQKCSIQVIPEIGTDTSTILFCKRSFHVVEDGFTDIGILGTLNRGIAALCEKEFFTPMHIYILTDGKLEVGDWALNMFGTNRSIFKITKLLTDGYEGQKKGEEFAFYGLGETLKKIVASTDKALDLPGIADEFIEEYIKDHNIEEFPDHYFLEVEEVLNEQEGTYDALLIPKISRGCILIDKEEVSLGRKFAIWTLRRGVPISVKRVEKLFNEFLKESNLELQIKSKDHEPT